MSSKTEKKQRKREQRTVAGVKAVGGKLASDRAVILYSHPQRPEGQATGELVTAADPDTGLTVEHAIRRDMTVADRMLKAGALGDPKEAGRRLHDAAEKFRQDFERAQLTGFVAAADLMRAGGGAGPSEIGDGVVAARQRVRFALGSLGFAPGTSRGSLTGKAAWWVLGCQENLEQFVQRMRMGGSLMDGSKASGLVIAAIERLALHYGLVSVGNIDQLERSRAWGKGVMSAARRLRQDAEREESAAAFAKRRALAGEDIDDDTMDGLIAETVERPIAAKALIIAAAALEAQARRIAGAE